MRGILDKIRCRDLALIALLLILQTRTVLAEAQVDVQLSPRSATVEEIFQLSVSVSGEKDMEITPPQFESSKAFSIEAIGTSTQHHISSAGHHTETTFSYSVVPEASLSPGRYQIPRGKIVVGNKVIWLQRPQLEITASQSTGNSRKDGAVDFVQIVDNLRPYVGQQILYRAEIVTDDRLRDGNLSEIDFAGFWREPFGSTPEIVRSVGNQNTRVHSIREALFPAKSGKLIIPSRVLSGRLRVSRRNPMRRGNPLMIDVWPQLFDIDQYNYAPRRYVASAVELEARPLPEPPQKNLKYIPVGKVRIESKVDRLNITQGESVNLTVDLVGDANLRPIELAEPIGKDRDAFKVYIDKPQIAAEPKDNRIYFRKRFSASFVPQRSGELELPQYQIIVFNPESEKYQILQTAAEKIVIKEDPNAQQLVTTAPATKTSQATPVPKQKEVKIVGQDILPQHLGRDIFQARDSMPRWLFWMFVILLPSTALVIRFKNYRERLLLADPAAALQKNAYSKAVTALDDAKAIVASPDQLRQVFRTYLGEKFRQDTSSCTSREMQDILREKITDKTLASRSTKLISDVEKLQFSRASLPSQELSSLRRETKQVITAINLHVDGINSNE